MGMSPGMYGETNDEESMRTIHQALEIGVTLLIQLMCMVMVIMKNYWVKG